MRPCWNVCATCASSSNLDEWFEVRSARMLRVAQTGEERDSYTRTRFAALMDKAQALVAHRIPHL